MPVAGGVGAGGGGGGGKGFWSISSAGVAGPAGLMVAVSRLAGY
jgi:hypothetical protein